PCAANALAMPSPIPLVEPGISAVFPFNMMDCLEFALISGRSHRMLVRADPIAALVIGGRTELTGGTRRRRKKECLGSTNKPCRRDRPRSLPAHLRKSTMSEIRTIVIVGGGFAGTTLARALDGKLPPGCELIVISEESYTTFNPLLPEALGA